MPKLYVLPRNSSNLNMCKCFKNQIWGCSTEISANYFENLGDWIRFKIQHNLKSWKLLCKTSLLELIFNRWRTRIGETSLESSLDFKSKFNPQKLGMIIVIKLRPLSLKMPLKKICVEVRYWKLHLWNCRSLAQGHWRYVLTHWNSYFYG